MKNDIRVLVSHLKNRFQPTTFRFNPLIKTNYIFILYTTIPFQRHTSPQKKINNFKKFSMLFPVFP